MFTMLLFFRYLRIASVYFFFSEWKTQQSTLISLSSKGIVFTFKFYNLTLTSVWLSDHKGSFLFTDKHSTPYRNDKRKENSLLETFNSLFWHVSKVLWLAFDTFYFILILTCTLQGTLRLAILLVIIIKSYERGLLLFAHLHVQITMCFQ